jgi:hypothetical protein
MHFPCCYAIPIPTCAEDEVGDGRLADAAPKERSARGRIGPLMRASRHWCVYYFPVYAGHTRLIFFATEPYPIEISLFESSSCTRFLNRKVLKGVEE